MEQGIQTASDEVTKRGSLFFFFLSGVLGV